MFEHIPISDNLNPLLKRAITLLRQSFETPSLPFSGHEDLVEALDVLEDSNLVKAQHQQELYQMLER